MSGKIDDWTRPNVQLKVPDEHTEQVNLLHRVRMLLPGIIYENTFAVPNGQVRDVRIARKLKAEGQRNGVPDLCLDIPRGPFHGFRCEMKRRNAKPSDWREDQREWAARLNANGFLAVVACGADQGFDQFKAFWDLGPFDPAAAVDLSVFQLELKGRR